MEIVVLGLGRFGRLWAECVSGFGSVYGYDPAITAQPDAQHFALLSGQNALNEAVQRCAALFFCVPISLLKSALEQLQQALAGRLGQTRPIWLMDTCSVKAKPLAQLEEAVHKLEWGQRAKPCESPFRVLGLHPMFGPDSATGAGRTASTGCTAGVELAGKRLVLCPASCAGRAPGITEAYKQGVHLWQRRFAALGLRTILMSADEHDREAARTQGLTHLLGRVLDAFGVAESPIATVGYEALCELREQTCHDTWQLFLDLQRQNGYTAAMRERLQAAFTSICALLEQDSQQ